MLRREQPPHRDLTNQDRRLVVELAVKEWVGEGHLDVHCPITGGAFADPVVAADGFTYEREAMSLWFRDRDTSPMTNRRLQTRRVYPNRTLRSLLADIQQAGAGPAPPPHRRGESSSTDGDGPPTSAAASGRPPLTGAARCFALIALAMVMLPALLSQNWLGTATCRLALEPWTNVDEPSYEPLDELVAEAEADRAKALRGWHARGRPHGSNLSAQDLVTEALSGWAALGGVSEHHVDVEVASDRDCFLVQWVDGALYQWPSSWPLESSFPTFLYRSRRLAILQLLQAALGSGPPSAADFEAVFCLEDCVKSQRDNASTSDHGPGFAPLRHLGSKYPARVGPRATFTIVRGLASMNIPFPIWDVNMRQRGQANGWLDVDNWDAVTEAIQTRAKATPWASRAPKAVFRGGIRTCTLDPNRTHYTAVSAWEKEHCGRLGLVYNAIGTSHATEQHMNSLVCSSAGGWLFPSEELKRVRWEQQQRRDMFDVNVGEGAPRSWGKQNYPGSLPMDAQEEYQLVLYAEGHCGWANRLRQQLHMGAVIVMQQTSAIEHYGMLLEPWVHYVPVDYHFGNLVARVAWALRNPVEAQAIRTRANSYAQSVITRGSTVAYAKLLMQEYAKLLTYKVKLRPGALKVDPVAVASAIEGEQRLTVVAEAGSSGAAARTASCTCLALMMAAVGQWQQ